MTDCRGVKYIIHSPIREPNRETGTDDIEYPVTVTGPGESKMHQVNGFYLTESEYSIYVKDGTVRVPGHVVNGVNYVEETPRMYDVNSTRVYRTMLKKS